MSKILKNIIHSASNPINVFSTMGAMSMSLPITEEATTPLSETE